ncbi:hypothetical protein F0562_023897 [Nyssa sinensis]|uniref:Uncharacterized protein n=1 Tax=Nyssa sinensis TaxID=561372 RepID=A0A5J5BHX7_9ASTE|nr:hypothetical protein F0562_023897 [Nyssa sinensis]
MPGDEDTANGLLQAMIAAMVRAVAKKNTEIGADRGSGHKGEANLNDVAMAALNRTILFVSVGAGQTMEDARVSKMQLSSVGIGYEGKVVKTGGDVMSSACVRIPVLVIVNCRRWSRRCEGVSEVGLGSGGGKGVKMVVEAIPTNGSGMADFGADLTRWFGGMGLWRQRRMVEGTPPASGSAAIVRSTAMGRRTTMTTTRGSGCKVCRR